MSVNWQAGHAPEDFQKLLRELIARTSRTLPQFLNSRAYMIAQKALDNTKRADKHEIEKLGVIGYNYVRSRATGLSKAGSRKNKKTGTRETIIVNEGGQMRNIIVGGYVNRHGSTKGFDFSDIKQRVQRALGKRLRSIGFLASTWRPILRALDRYAQSKGTVRPEGAHKHVNIKSYAKKAQEGWNPTVEFGCVVGEDKYGNPLRPYAQGLLTEALNKAFVLETAEMKAHLEKKLAEELQKSKGLS